MAIGSSLLDSIAVDRQALWNTMLWSQKWTSLICLIVVLLVSVVGAFGVCFLGARSCRYNENIHAINIAALLVLLLGITLVLVFIIAWSKESLYRKYEQMLRLEVSLRHKDGLEHDFNVFFPKLEGVVDKNVGPVSAVANVSNAVQYRADFKFAEALIEKVFEDPTKAMR